MSTEMLLLHQQDFDVQWIILESYRINQNDLQPYIYQ